MINQELKNQIIEIFNKDLGPLSRTAVSTMVGFSRKSKQVSDIIEDLLEEGFITEDSTMNVPYSVYIKNPSWDIDDEDDEDDEEDEDDLEWNGEEDEDGEDDGEEIPQMVSPTADLSSSRGYKIVKTGCGFEVETPDGKFVSFKENERLLVVNDNPKYRWVIDCPEAVFEGIKNFVNDNGISTYIISDVSSGVPVNSVTDINMKTAVIFVDVVRHNKAGF